MNKFEKEALAYLETLASFGGTAQQSRELAQKGVDKLNEILNPTTTSGSHTHSIDKTTPYDFSINALTKTWEPLYTAPQASADAAQVRRDTLLSVVQALNGNPYSLTKRECIDVVQYMFEKAASALQSTPAEGGDGDAK